MDGREAISALDRGPKQPRSADQQHRRTEESGERTAANQRASAVDGGAGEADEDRQGQSDEGSQ